MVSSHVIIVDIVNKLVIADEEGLWRELGICLYNVRDTLLNK